MSLIFTNLKTKMRCLNSVLINKSGIPNLQMHGQAFLFQCLYTPFLGMQNLDRIPTNIQTSEKFNLFPCKFECDYIIFNCFVLIFSWFHWHTFWLLLSCDSKQCNCNILCTTYTIKFSSLKMGQCGSFRTLLSFSQNWMECMISN